LKALPPTHARGNRADAEGAGLHRSQRDAKGDHCVDGVAHLGVPALSLEHLADGESVRRHRGEPERAEVLDPGIYVKLEFGDHRLSDKKLLLGSDEFEQGEFGFRVGIAGRRSTRLKARSISAAEM